MQSEVSKSQKLLIRERNNQRSWQDDRRYARPDGRVYDGCVEEAGVLRREITRRNIEALDDTCPLGR